MADNDTKPLTEAAIDAWVEKARNQNFGGFPGNPCGSYVLHGSEIIEALNMLHGALAEIAELRERIEKLDGDVDHFHRKWREAETRAEKAEAERDSAQAEADAVTKGAIQVEATSGVAMLRRLREKIVVAMPMSPEGADPVAREIRAKAQAFHCVLGWIGDLIAEKPAEPDDDQLDAVASLLDGPKPKDREGDEVLRRAARTGHYVDLYSSNLPDCVEDAVEAVAELCRRALGEGR